MGGQDPLEVPDGEKPKRSPRGCCSCSLNSCLILLLFLYEGAAYNGIFCWMILPRVGKLDLQTYFLAVFNSLWVLALLSYLRARCADPGKIPASWYAFVCSAGEALHIVPTREGCWQPGKATFCESCCMPRPERAHHCRVCDMCVLRMDHHCSWLNNCVGFYNYKYFLLLGIYGLLVSIASLASMLPELVDCAVAVANNQIGSCGGGFSLIIRPATYEEHLHGYVPTGDTIEQVLMSLRQAENHCAALGTECKGFTFKAHQVWKRALEEVALEEEEEEEPERPANATAENSGLSPANLSYENASIEETSGDFMPHLEDEEDESLKKMFFKSKWVWIKNNDWRTNNLGWTSHRKTSEATGMPALVYAFLASGLLPLFAIFFFAALLSGHCPLALRNITSIETKYDNMANPFDHHSGITNLEQVLGRCGCDWCLPFGPCRPQSTGVAFQRPDADEDGGSREDSALLAQEKNEDGESQNSEFCIWRRRYGAHGDMG